MGAQSNTDPVIWEHSMNNSVKRLLWILIPFILGVTLVRVTTPSQVTLTWETASEVDAAGFRLYRSDNPEGPFTLISPELIPARGDPLVGAKYSYKDTGLIWGRRYYYQLEEVNLTGGGERYSQTVTSLAGPGWLLALGAGASLALLGFLLPLRKPAPAAESQTPGPPEV